jgi:hypothetical protein
MLRWHKYVLGFCLVAFALEIGLFLLFFPWTQWWDLNWIPVHSRSLAELWLSPYVRGAISGLGALDIYIAFAELVRQIRSIFTDRYRT